MRTPYPLPSLASILLAPASSARAEDAVNVQHAPYTSLPADLAFRHASSDGPQWH